MENLKCEGKVEKSLKFCILNQLTIVNTFSLYLHRNITFSAIMTRKNTEKMEILKLFGGVENSQEYLKLYWMLMVFSIYDMLMVYDRSIRTCGI